MKTYTASAAKKRFGEFIALAQSEPVIITRRNKAVAVLVPVQDYESMRAFFACRLVCTMDAAAREAADAGLTPERLGELLARLPRP